MSDSFHYLCSGNGQSMEPETALRLKAGPLEMDLIEGELRYVSVGDSEAVRRIYAAVRDASWNTIAASRSSLEVVRSAEEFSVSWQNVHLDGEIDFTWTSRIVGKRDGSVRWEFDGVARRDFARNRIGFCILHPLATCQGQPCEVEHVSGEVAQRVFPDLIDPAQPVRGLHDYRWMKHGVNAEWDVVLEMEGDVFEMEDQRNWTDASFKTYSTPQRIPLPVRVRAGQTIRQVMTVRLVAKENAIATQLNEHQPVLKVSLAGDEVVPFPQIGLGMPSHGGTMSGVEVERLRALKLDHLRVDVRISQADWREVMGGAAAEAARLDLGLEVALHLVNDTRAAAVTAEAVTLAGMVSRWLVLEEGKGVVSPALLGVVRPLLAGKAGAGTDIDFFPLNNNRPAVDSADFIFCSIRPQAHAFDDASVIENLDGQTHLVASARKIFGTLPFVASPVTLKRRWHKGSARPAHELPPMVDVRQLSLLGAGWLVGSLRALTEAGAASVTWFETTGWRGVMEVASGSPLPGEFPSVPGGVFPMYHVLRAVADFREGGLRPVHLSHPLLVQAAVLQAGNRQLWIVANVTAIPRKVHFPCAGQLRFLDATSAAECALEPSSFAEKASISFVGGALELPAWSLAFVRVE